MIYALKAALLFLLHPVAALAGASKAIRRLWSHARLAAEIDFPLDPSVVVLGVPEIHGTRQIRLGRDLLLYPDIHLETREGGVIEIGDGVVISRGVHIVAFSRIVIGKYSMIGEYSSIRDANHHRCGNQPIRYSGHSARPVLIGSNVWIGRGVSILAGTCIGDNATIGANAVVTRSIDAGSVAAGVPARPLAAQRSSKEEACEVRR